MRLQDIFENDDDDHAEALEQSGFWGRKGAGCIILAKDTGKLLIVHRSAYVEEPHTWGTIGGAIDSKEDPAKAVKREIHEETGYHGPIELQALYVFKKNDFSYHNFLVIVDEEFTPRLDWENDGYVWCTLDTLPKPLHFGLVGLLKDVPSLATIKKAIAKYTRPE